LTLEITLSERRGAKVVDPIVKCALRDIGDLINKSSGLAEEIKSNLPGADAFVSEAEDEAETAEFA
jgi:hypothetical protein